MSTVTRQDISSELAHAMVGAAVGHARERGWEICAVVCDARGHLAALARTDGVQVPSIDFAIDKAYTAATLARSTLGFAESAAGRPPLAMGLANRPRLLVFPGGLPIFLGEVCVGGLGVSGATDEDDVACGIHVIEAAGFATRA